MKKRETAEKIAIYRKLFTGLLHVYGTYDPGTGHTRQVKAPVTDRVVYDHLKGYRPYGVYLLVEDRTRAIAVDFDSENRLTVVNFVNKANDYGISAYIERSKSKGYHVWIFFEEQGVSAAKARLVAHHLLKEIEEPRTEVYPKQDETNKKNPYGSFINAPLFGPLVLQGKTVFLDPQDFIPYPDQWTLLESVNKPSETTLNDIIEINSLSFSSPSENPKHDTENGNSRFILPICARRILQDGVSRFQRDSCFRLAVHLKRTGFPSDITAAALKAWALKNKPANGNGVIQDSEIIEAITRVYNKSYTGFGCNTEAIAPLCEPSCPIKQWREKNAVPSKIMEENKAEVR
jgi:hypothetical protein